MKSLLIPALMLVLSPLAHAEVLCGKLYTLNFSPPCTTNICSHHMSVELMIQKIDGEKIFVSSESNDVLLETERLVGDEVCARGEYTKRDAKNDVYFKMSAIRRSMSLNSAE